MTSFRVVVLGPAEAGKSTLIAALCDDALNLEYQGRTVAMDHARLRRDDAVITMIGVPGQERFAPVREVLSARACGAVWVQTAGQEPDRPTTELVRNLGKDNRSFRYLVVINQRRDDRKDLAWSAPVGLPRPFEVIAGNLIDDKTLSRRIETALWSLVDGQRCSEVGANEWRRL